MSKSRSKKRRKRDKRARLRGESPPEPKKRY